MAEGILDEPTGEDMELEAAPSTGDEPSNTVEIDKDTEEGKFKIQTIINIVEKSVEEKRFDETKGKINHSELEDPSLVKLGPKSFSCSFDMFDYFFCFLHSWPPEVNINKYEHIVLEELVKKGHPEPEKKIGGGIKAFQVRYHPLWKTRCFFLIGEDNSADDFSYRKCVDNILPLPENMKIKAQANTSLKKTKGKGNH